MDQSLLRDGLTLISGIATGIMSGTFGVGGAVISTPAIRALGCTAALAVGTTLPSILPGAITGSWRHRNGDLIQWQVIACTAPAGIVASVCGALISPRVPGDGHWLMVLTAVVLMWSAINMIRSVDRSAAHSQASDKPRSPKTYAIVAGILAGGLSGLLGLGGGILMVPLFRRWLKLPIKHAVATSLICVGSFAIPGTITHGLENGIDWRFALWLTLGVVVGAPLGSKLASKMSDHRLQRAFGIFLAVIAIIYAGGELLAL